MKMLLSAKHKILEKIHEQTEVVPDQSILQETGCFVLLLKDASWHCMSAAESQLLSKNVQSVVSGKEGSNCKAHAP